MRRIVLLARVNFTILAGAASSGLGNNIHSGHPHDLMMAAQTMTWTTLLHDDFDWMAGLSMLTWVNQVSIEHVCVCALAKGLCEAPSFPCRAFILPITN